jgi:hypothetical protein
MLSPTGVLRTEGFAYALDNGAWTAYNSKTAWDESAFVDALARFGKEADFVVSPDIVGGGLDSLRLSISWLHRCMGSRTPRVLIPVQDGMQPRDIVGDLCRQIGIFVGGTDKWKEKSTPVWAELADERRSFIHVGRVNSQRRLRICQMAGVDSFDGSGPSRFAKHLAVMERGLAQPCFRVQEQEEPVIREDPGRDEVTIAALFVEKNGAYYGLDGVDPWDIERDARKYAGPHPVVAHPPCSRWCALAGVNQARYGHRIGDDGGCFAHALHAVRTYGGVLEHPAETKAWRAFSLPDPALGGWSRESFFMPGWVCEVAQSAYGHPARKRTWLYYVGDALPPSLNWSRPRGTHQIGHDHKAKRSLPRLSNKQALKTPEQFRDLLLSIARGARRCE